MPPVRAIAIVGLAASAAIAEAAPPEAARDRIIGAIACVAPMPFLPEHLSRPEDGSDRLGWVPPGNCYPTGGCGDGWCAVETVNGMGWTPDRGITVIVPPAPSGDAPIGQPVPPPLPQQGARAP